MIRCIPVDGSPPFEVENDEPLERWHEDGTREQALARDVASSSSPNGWEQVLSTNPQSELLRIESWRERAERFEGALREIAEQDANTCRPGWKHWATRAADALGIPVPW